MKKYFNKIIVISLLAIILPMTSSGCFQELFGLSVKVNIAEAATSLNLADSLINSPFNNIDDCSQESIQKPFNNLPETSHHNSLLPCCFDGAHFNVANSSSAFELEKFIPIIVFNTDNTIIASQAETIYHEPIIAPPELSIIKKTVLRL
jgi:hypothetical protein